MRQIRQSTFETNSSSTHTISIQTTNVREDSYFRFYTECLLDLVDSNLHGFGWEHTKYYDCIDKFHYLLIAISSFPETFKENKQKIKFYLSEIKIKVVWPVIKMKVGKDGCPWIEIYSDKEHCSRKLNNYIDHPEDLEPFINYVLESEDHLYNFLWGKESAIETGNDNEGTYGKEWDLFREDENENYRDSYEQDGMIYFFKGN